PADDGATVAPVEQEQQDDSDVRFGERGARLTYGSYLHLPRLRDSQHLESDPPAHDELLFITIHQVYELWFQQLLHEAGSARQAVYDGKLGGAQHTANQMAGVHR